MKQINTSRFSSSSCLQYLWNDSSPARNGTAARYFASLYDIVSRRWPLASFGLLDRWKESQRRSPVWESRQLSQKGESPPWQIPDARTAAVRLLSSERDRENTLWPESALGRRVPGLLCTRNRSSCPRSSVPANSRDCVRSFVRGWGGRRFASIEGQTSWTLSDNFQIGQWTHRSRDSAALFQRDLPARPFPRVKELHFSSKEKSQVRLHQRNEEVSFVWWIANTFRYPSR